MPVTSKCKFPHDLNYAIKLLEEDIGARLIANQELLKDAENSIEGLDALLNEGNTILDDLLSKNGAGTATSSDIKTSADVATQFGLLPDDSTTEEDEKFVANADILLFDKVVYLAGSKSDNPLDAKNISTLRRLYFSVGKDLTKVDSILSNSTKTIFIHDGLILSIVPRKEYGTAYTLDEIRSMYNLYELDDEDIARCDDSSTLVLIKEFLAQDQAKAKTISTGLPPYKLISNVFHLQDGDTSAIAIERYKSLGYAGEELSTIMLGQDYIDAFRITVINTVDKLHAEAVRLISLVSFMQSRPANSVTPEAYNVFFRNLQVSLQQLSLDHQSLISLLKFEVSQYLQTDVLTKLRKKHTDDQIKYLLERRKDIEGFYFDPPDDLYLLYLRRSLDAAVPDSTYISNQFVNKGHGTKYDQKAVLDMYTFLVDATRYASIRSNQSLTKITIYLYWYIGKTPILTESPTGILDGQPSTASPSEILAERFDVMKSMDFDARKQEVKDSFKDLYDMYPASIAGPLSDVINAMVDIFEKCFKAIDFIISQAEKTLFALKKKLDSWLSKHASLTGKGDFNSSLLKCAINWDIGVSTDILEKLFDFIMKILAQVLAFLSNLKAWIADILTKILCLPVNLLNSILGKVEMALPSACKIPRFDLGTKLNDSLTKLLKVGAAKQIVLTSFSKDIARVRMSVSAAPDRLGQFKQSAFCDSGASSNFMNASVLNVSAGVPL